MFDATSSYVSNMVVFVHPQLMVLTKYENFCDIMHILSLHFILLGRCQHKQVLNNIRESHIGISRTGVGLK